MSLTTELSYPLPEIGEESISADPRTLQALVEIKSWAKGQIDSTNLKAGGIETAALKNEAVTEAKLSTAVAALLNAKTSGIAIKIYAGAATLKAGELAYQEKNGETFKLPSAATPNQVIGVGSFVPNAKVKAEGGATFRGDFINEATEITLTTNQHVLLQSTGSVWLIVAGEPKCESVPTEVRTARAGEATNFKASETRPALVTVVPSGAITLFVAGKTVLSGETVSSYTFWLNPGQTWAYTGAATTSTYFIQ